MALTATGLENGRFPGNMLFYWLDALLSGFSRDYWRLKLALVIIVGAATGAKVFLSVRFVGHELRRSAGGGPRLPELAGWAAMLVFLVAVAFSLPGHNEYLGQIPPNIWHNSTTMLLMPFAVGLFWTSLCFLRTGDTRFLWWSLPLIALNILAKPSLVLCLFPVFPIAAAIRFGRSGTTLRAWALIAAGMLMLALQYVYIYVAGPGVEDSSSSVIVDPLAVWHLYTREIPRALLASYLFPVVALVLGGRRVWRSEAVRYALALATSGLLEFCLLSETGARRGDGNFLWQAAITNYLLFLTIVSALIPWLAASRRRDPRLVLIGVAFAAHVWAGLHYLDHWFSTGTFV